MNGLARRFGLGCALADQPGIVGEFASREPETVSTEPFLRGGQAGQAGDHADAAVTELGEVLDQSHGRLLVVGSDLVEVR